MKILAIRTYNLASLAGLNEINFTEEPLQSIGIFAITGATGAGKSTILDALCLALYGETPRYTGAEMSVNIIDSTGSSTKQNDVRRILRNGTAEGYAEVDFIGMDSDYYRSRWSVRRARGNATGNLQPDTMQLTNIIGEIPIPGRKTDILKKNVELIGLSFEQFTRSVLLAQGEFTAFLKANKNQKASLLEKLTGSEIYSRISVWIYNKYKSESEKLNFLRARNEGITVYTEEELVEIQEQINASTVLHGELNTTLTNLTKEKNWHSQNTDYNQLVNDATKKLEESKRQKANSLEREILLKRIENVQPTRQLMSKLDTDSQNFKLKENEEKEYSNLLINLKNNEENTILERDESSKALTKKEQDSENAQPQLKKAGELDVKLAEAHNQIVSAGNEYDKAKTNFEEQTKALAEKEIEVNELDNEIRELKTKLENNKNREPIADNENIILEKLKNASTSLASLNESEENIKNEEIKIQDNRKNHENLTKEIEEIRSNIEDKEVIFSHLKEAISVVSIDDLVDSKSEIDVELADVISAVSHWQRLFETLETVDKLDQNYSKSKELLEKTQSDLDLSKAELGVLESEKEKAQSLLDKAKIAATESVEEMREQLIENEPCPVCGSKEHPYKTENVQLHNVLEMLENEYKTANEKYLQHTNLSIGLEYQLIDIKKTITVLEDEIPQKKVELTNLNEKWSEFRVFSEAEKISVEERGSWLSDLMEEIRNKQSKLHQEIVDYNNQKKQYDEESKLLISMNKNLNLIENSLKDVERDFKTYESNLKHFEHNQKTAQKFLTETESSVSEYINTLDWFENWQKNPESFIQKIAEFASNWRNDKNKLVEKERRFEILKTEIEGMKKQLDSLKTELDLKEMKLNDIKSNRDSINRERSNIFDGKSVEIVENELKTAILNAKEILKEKERKLKKVQDSITETKAKLKQTEIDKTRWEKELTNSKIALNDWISKFNRDKNDDLTIDFLGELLTYDQNWIESEKTEINQIDNALTVSQTAYNERYNDLKLHQEKRISEKESDEVNVLFEETEIKLKETADKINDIKNLLKENDRKKAEIADILVEINKQRIVSDDWGKLSELIGSADGNKFRQVAQEYTLDVLLVYANEHLKVLNKRYLLQRTATELGLQVIDQDMGDEVRSVYSLSGGETFLVSLALALGLASLSSNEVQVETLFIDEGFGSLDSNTLNIAMDALERLHNQGRKVGVISHVQEMTERIPVQIHVSKQQSGRSIIEVKSNVMSF